MTVFQYLDKVRQENPQYQRLNNASLYRKLKGVDINLPAWEALDKPRVSSLVKSNKQEPGFVNSLFDWTDYGISETSAKFAKSAYNNSITGLAYQLYNGEERFDLGEYNPGVVEDIGSMILSFAMPLDIASLFVGGYAGKALSTPLNAGVKKKAVEALSGKAAFAKQFGKEQVKKTSQKFLKEQGIKQSSLQARKEIAERHVQSIIEDLGVSALYKTPGVAIQAAAISQGATLATFEGVRGALSAATQGEDVFKGAAEGVFNGGFVGALSGVVGAGLAVQHGKLFAKYADKDMLTFGQKAKLLGTGVPGQIAAESLVFSPWEIQQAMTDPDYGMEELMRQVFINAGMMSILKAKNKVWEKGKNELGRWYETEGVIEYNEAKKAIEAVDNVKKTIDEMPEDTPIQKEVKASARNQLSEFENRQYAKHKATVEDFEGWEAEYQRSLDIINGKSDLTASIDDVQTIMKTVAKIRGSMELNKKRGFGTDKTQFTDAEIKQNIKEREVLIKQLEVFENQWKKDIEEPLYNLDRGLDKDAAEKQTKVGWLAARDDAIANNRRSQIAELREGLEDAVDSNGNIIDGAKFKEKNNIAEMNQKAYNEVYRPVTNKFDSFEQQAKKEAAEDFEQLIENLPELKTEKTPEGLVASKALINANTRIQDKVYENPTGDTTPAQSDAYNISKRILKYHAQKYLPKKTKGGAQGTQLGHAEKLAYDLAKKGKSLFDIVDDDIDMFIESYTTVPQASVTKIIGALADIAKRKKRKARELFSEDFTYVDEGTDLSSVISAKFKSLKNKGGRTGARIPQEGELTKYETSGKITMSSKTGLIEKFTSTNVIKKVKSLINSIKKIPTRKGHEGYLFRVKDGSDLVAIRIEQVNAIIKSLFGEKRLPGQAGEGRLFRKAISQWGAEKYGTNTAEAEIIFKHITGHGEGANVKKTYESSFAKNEIPGQVQRILKEFMADIKNPKSENYGVAKEGYTTKELAKGYKELDKRLKNKKDNVFEYTDSKGKKKSVTIDNATLETMVEYMVQTGPRLNEVGIADNIFRAVEEMNAKNQLDVKLKAGENLVDARTLADQVKFVKQKFPQLSVKIENTLGKVNGQHVLGKIHGHMIKIAADKARMDTLPHEVSHHVVDVLKEMGDPTSKKIVNDGIRMFKKKGMNDAQAEEALVQALGEYTSKTLKQGMIGRMKSWVKRTVSYMRNYFGMRNQADVDGMRRDVVRIIGGRVLSGKIPTDYLNLSERMEVKYQTADSASGKKTINILLKDVERAREDARIFGADKAIMDSIEDDVLRGRSIKDKSVTGGDLMEIADAYKLYFDTSVQDRSPEFRANYAKVKKLEADYDISDARRDAYFERFRVPFEKATPEMIDTYRSYITLGDKIEPLQNSVATELQAISTTNTHGSTNIFMRPLMKAADVIKKFSPEIARRLELHDFTRSFKMKGPGAEQIEIIKNIVTDERVRKNYMHMIDPELAENSINQLKELAQKDRRRFYAEYVSALAAKRAFEPGGKYFEATQRWKETSNFYYNSLKRAVTKNATSKAQAKQIIDGLNEKYIQQYFVRRPTREVVEFLNSKHPAIEKIIKGAKRNLSKKDIAEIQKTGKTVDDVLADEVMNMVRYGPQKAQINYLKQRSVTLPEYIEVPSKFGKKKLVKSYESDIDATLQTYVNGMSKFVATVEHFPEFTELGSKLNLKGGTSKAILETLQRKADELGGMNNDAIYAIEVIKKQIGLDSNMIDRLNQPVSEIVGKITNLSAVLGLSSPLAGVKNFMIQLPRSIAVYGARNTFKGLSKAMDAGLLNPFANPLNKEWLKAVKRGETGYGQKELLFGTDKRIKWWFENVNLMEQTENLNRIMTAEAGKLHFAELVQAFRGERTPFFKKPKAAEINRMFTDIFRLSDDQIKILKETKDLMNSVEYENILDYVGFSAHKASAGATGVSDLPLWMSNKYFKPLTLFQRMAYSVSIDSYKNYIKPLVKNKNIAPLLKATVGHMAVGAALYGMYDKLMGQQVPTEENSVLDRAISNVWRGELLGVLGETVSPYRQRGNINPLSEPVIVRNIRSGVQEVMNMVNNGKPVDMALKDFARQTVVIGIQAEKMWNQATSPYAVSAKRVASLESNWRKQNGKGYEKTSGGVLRERHYAYRRLRNAVSLSYTDEQIAQAYYVAYNTIINERLSGGYVNMKINEKHARQAIMTMMKKMNPLDISNEDKGRIISKRQEFLKSLSPENRDMALKAEKEFQYRLRKFEKIINLYKYKKRFANHL